MQKAVLSEVVEDDVMKDIYERIVKNFLDMLVLLELRKKTLSGYDIIAIIHRRFNFLISSGTVYSLLYSLERKGLTKAIWNQRRREYTLTEKGKQLAQIILSKREKIKALADSVL